MSRWIQKFVQQFEWGSKQPGEVTPEVSEERATLLFVIDTINKHLFDIEGHPVRKERETLDEFARELLRPDAPSPEKIFFRFRQHFASYRIAEYTYLQKTFDEFRQIIWDFVDQLGEEFQIEEAADNELNKSLNELREAVEADSIEEVKMQSRKFIDSYIEYQTKRDESRNHRIKSIKGNLDIVRKQLFEANESMRLDHLTGAYNRKSFDEQIRQHIRMFDVTGSPTTLVSLDIDYFKKINDNYGHAMGDFVLKECVKLLKEMTANHKALVARVGGEEFTLLLADADLDIAVELVEKIMARMRKEVYVDNGQEVRFTSSFGIAMLGKGEKAEEWLKRADAALYQAKHEGRNRFVVALPQDETKSAA